ncbi:MAG: B12-binding domain-containing radical SAM protein [Treponema sp.]|jgi:radical SAM superfamily enzyme YgiQ (UPF0313 family)|nr:B12-binding domain-containing radical SAM protein [Treponema sp.]
MKDILLTTINAKWIHPSLALRLLKANLGKLEDRCEIIEFALRQPLQEKIDALSSGHPQILGFSVSIWNHTATLDLLKELKKVWVKKGKINEHNSLQPVIVLGGPEVSHLPEDAEIFQYADYVIRGEGEIVFRELCEKFLNGEKPPKFILAENVNVNEIKSAYHLYTDEDVARKLIYVEASRGCPFNCEFCLSAADAHSVREFPLEPFFAEMDALIMRGVKTFKFLDRTFNANIKRAIVIMIFFLEKLKERTFTVHFEMVPILFTPELRETLTRFPPGSLRLEIGIQTLTPEAAARIGLPGRQAGLSERQTGQPDKILEPLRFLCEKTNAIIHADLIAGLPGENIESFGNGFNLLLAALEGGQGRTEIQLGILKQLPGAPIARHNKEWGMRYNSEPPYEVIETSAMSADDISRLKNFARFWEIIVNRGLFDTDFPQKKETFNNFMKLSDTLFSRFGKNWGIDKEKLIEVVLEISF